MHYPYTLKNNIYHSNRRNLFKQTETTTIFHSDIDPVLGHVLVYSLDKNHVLDATVELIWLLLLNILSFNLAETPNKSLGSQNSEKLPYAYENHPTVVLIKVMLHFCLISSVQNDQVPIFCTCLSSMIVHLHNLFLLSTPVTRKLWAPRWVSGRKDVKWLSINISKLKVGVTHSISRRTSFSPYPYLIDISLCLSLFLYDCITWCSQQTFKK